MKILLIHNYYQQPGGEDSVFIAENLLLSNYGHTVIKYTDHNKLLSSKSRVTNAIEAIWSRRSYSRLKKLLSVAKPDIAHFHNTFLRISPSAYYICQEYDVPVVQTLHNYRLLCPSATLFRNGHVCEECIGTFMPYPGLVHGCWRNSRVQTIVPVVSIMMHRLIHTWRKQVNAYIALTEFARRKLILGGLPANRFFVKPNFVYPDPEVSREQREYALFVGRLSYEKGVSTLLAAWRKLQGSIPLLIIGDGPLKHDVAEITRTSTGVKWLGRKSASEVYDLMGRAAFLIFPSECYETFGRVAIESFAKGTPVLAARLGAITEIVTEKETGLFFRPGDPDDLAAKASWAWTHQKQMRVMGQKARQEYEKKYTAERNYERLMAIYNYVMSK